MSITNLSVLEWAGNIGTIEYTANQCLKITVAYTRYKDNSPNETSWMTCVFSKNQTTMFGPKLNVGDSIAVKGELNVGVYQNQKSVTLFVRQVLQHEPKGVKNLTNLYFQAAKVGNHQALELMRNTHHFNNLFWQFIQQVLPGTPIPQQQQAPQQPVQQNAPQQPVQQNAPQQPVQQNAPQQTVQQNAPQQTVQQNASQQPVQQNATQHPVQQNAPQQPVQQNAPQQTVQQNAPQQTVQQNAPQQTVQQNAPQQTVQQNAPQQTVQQNAPQQTVQQNAPQQAVQKEVPQEMGQINVSSLPQHLLDQIKQYQNEGGAPISETPDFKANTELSVPDELMTNAASIAANELGNSDHFFTPNQNTNGAQYNV
ncbi:single-stranded DNA-binding protein [Vibrio sp. Makdt]|uniref:single-stranded DNA-binding protein n=1 Tax=Vibrio sp. Makdt TaxID=2998828 RepID=UPI0022CD9B16|nr:single-stranded DNA-binding protein [Vibrio sp. Makdt]MDA0152398.1 single-stranded DNA-binding protein [Vibrio sp. Makdt]